MVRKIYNYCIKSVKKINNKKFKICFEITFKILFSLDKFIFCPHRKCMLHVIIHLLNDAMGTVNK